MKKILLSAAALLTLLFAASCQKEDFSGADGEFATVTLTVQAPASPSTKALGDGTKAKNLVFGVFDENGAELTDLRQGDWMNANQTEITFNDQLQAKVTVNLAKGKTYTFICWAQTKEYGDATNPTAVTCYDFKNLDDIKVDYTVNNEANNEHRDAFYACVTSGIIKKDYSTTITLTRPFGQLNIGTNDMAAAQSAGLDLANLWVELSVTNCPTHLVADMDKHVYTVDGSVTAKFTKALCPASVNLAETLNVDLDGDKAFAENEKFGWLSMNYIFTAHQEVKDDATKNITFDLYEGDLSLAKYSRDNVPFIANYRTNLLGRLLTTDGDITVIIDPVPDGDENITGGIEDVSVITLDELNAVTAAGTYNVGGTLTKDGVKSAAMGAGYEDVEIKDADNNTATYTLKVPTTKANVEYEAYYKAGGYLIVAVDAAVAEDGKVTLKAKDTHVAYVPEGIEDEEEEEPALKATLAVDPATITLDKADAATVEFTVTAENCTWTATCDNENVKCDIAENVVNVTVPANEDTEKEATYVVTVTPAVEEGVEKCEPVTVKITQAKKEAAVEPEPTEVVLYLVPNANWKVDNARFAAYFFGNGETWVDMTDEDGDGVYELVVPAGFEDIIFCRMSPTATENNWNNKWNQTSDLKVPTDGTNCYTVAEGAWDKGEGTWSTFTPATEPEEPETDQVLPDGSYYVVVNGKVATPLTSNYGYLKVSNGKNNTEANAFLFTYVPEQKAYTIQDANSYYYYQTGTYNSFNRSETLPAAGAYWTIEKEENKYRITNTSVSKTIQYDPEYNSYGSYSTVEALLPELLTLDTVIPYVVLSETSISVDPTATSVKFQIFANIPWTASVEGEAEISLSSGSEDAEITVSFNVNTSTESNKTYIVTISSMIGNESLNITHSKVQSGETVADVLTASLFAATSTTYTEFSGVKATSSAVYAGKSAKTDQGGIQLRSSKSEDGIVTTASGGNIRKVKVVWQDNTTDGRTLDIYGSSEAYTSAKELYGTNLKGEKIGSIVFGTSTELEISGDYPYVGLRSNNGAMYLESIELIYE